MKSPTRSLKYVSCETMWVHETFWFTGAGLSSIESVLLINCWELVMLLVGHNDIAMCRSYIISG